MTASDVLSAEPVPVTEPGLIFSYKTPGPHVTWEWALERLHATKNYWLVTDGLDGMPHARPLWGFWERGGFWFGTVNRSVQNLAANSKAVVHTESGNEVVIVEGVCEQLTGLENTELVVRVYKEKYNHDTYATEEGVFTPEGYGGPIFKLTPKKALGWVAESEQDGKIVTNFQSATRFIFPAERGA